MSAIAFTRRSSALFTEPNYARLSDPIDASNVKQRAGGRGGTLSYIETHQAIRAANDIFGVGGWGYEVVDLTQLGEPEPVKKDDRTGYRVGYRATVRVTVNLKSIVGPEGGVHVPTVSFSDVGYGDGMEYTNSRITVHELAVKEAVSDGVKRALKNFGSQFGLDLYDKDARVEIEKRAKLAGSSVATLKKEVWKLAEAELGAKPTAAKMAALFGVEAADLQEKDTLLTILRSKGVV